VQYIYVNLVTKERALCGLVKNRRFWSLDYRERKMSTEDREFPRAARA
jgi:hypothetical protein